MSRESLETLNRLVLIPRTARQRVRRNRGGQLFGTVSAPWADGFGRWHVQVEAMGSVRAQRERARRAIAREVRARQGEQRVSIRLGSPPPATDTGRRTWSEPAD